MLVAQGRYEAAAKHVRSSEREAFLMGVALVGGLAEAFGSAEPHRIEITHEEIYGDEAEVAYVVHYRDGSSSWEEWEYLVKVGGKWKVSVY